MYKRLLEFVFGVSIETLAFVSDTKARYRKRLWVLLPLSAWAAIFYHFSPLLVKWQVDSLTQSWTSLLQIQLGEVWKVFIAIAVLTLSLNLINAVFSFAKNRFLNKTKQETEAYLEDKFNTALQKFDGSFLGSENNIRLIRHLQWRIDSIDQQFIDLLQKSIETVVGLIALVTILPLIHPILLAIMMISVIVDMIIDWKQNQTWRQFELIESRQSEQRGELRWRIIWYFNQLLANSWLNEITKIYRRRRESLFQTQLKQSNLDQTFWLIKETSRVTTYALATLAGGYLFLSGQLAIGTFVVFGLYIDRLKTQVTDLGDTFRLLFQTRFELFRFDFLLHIKPKLDYTNIKPFKTTNIDSITIQNLNFTYPEFFQEEIDYLNKMKERAGILESIDKKKTEPKTPLSNQIWWKKIVNFLINKVTHQSLSAWSRKRLQEEFKELEELFSKAQTNYPILSSLDTTFSKGNIYAIVGYNGAGKTTLTRLLKRMLDPTSGSILVNDTDLKTIDPLKWKEYISSLEQQNFLWESLTIRENLLLGIDDKAKKDISDEFLWAILKKVGLDDVITNLDAVLGEGVALSGGQSQLLEIARVYLQNKPIVILDEGTNQLDAVKENLVIELLQEIKSKSIVIFITHRMTTCARSDKVLILENGKLVESGAPQELLQSSKPNLFQKFWNLQVQGKSIEEENQEVTA